MSARVPPDDPTQAARQEAAEYYQKLLAEAEQEFRARQGLPPRPEYRTPEYRIAEQMGLPVRTESPVMVNQTLGISGWITTGLQSITLVTILGGMFWLGSLSNTVTNNGQKLDKLNDGVVGISKDSLSNRMIAIETKIDEINKKLDSGSQTPQPARR